MPQPRGLNFADGASRTALKVQANFSYNRHLTTRNLTAYNPMTHLQTAIQAAHAAGDVLRKKFTQARATTSKGFRDIVTDADVAAQDACLSVITTYFPTHHILAEEGRHDLDLNASTPTWIIDPLDGTSNYARQVPLFAVCVALAQNGQLQVGVVYDPLREELFYAERGAGAFGQVAGGAAERLQVSAVSDLGEAAVAMGFPRDPATRTLANQLDARMGAACQGLRGLGSAGLHLAYVAAGRLEACYHLALQPWDIAAGALLITEAGGSLTMLNGAAWHLGEGRVLASNGQLHSSLVQALAWE
jgi:myo-inositol-1(or 4)-monophosphatase